MIIKYRIHELAKDLNMQSREILDFFEEQKIDMEKKHMSVLTDQQLNMFFDFLTQNNQTESLESYITGIKAETKEKLEKVENADKKMTKVDRKTAISSKQQVDLKTGEADKTSDAKITQNQPQVPTGTRGKTVRVDTGAADVNLEKYDEKYEELAASKGEEDATGGRKRSDKGKASRRKRQQINRRGQDEKSRKDQEALEKARKMQHTVLIPDTITVGELASRMKVSVSSLIKKLMSLGMMAGINDVLDHDTAALLAMEMNIKVEKEVIETIEDKLFELDEDNETNLVERNPVIVVMGHVDHGKTSLLDAIRNAKVTEGEAGGITQHIGAYKVPVGDKFITFLDTPGHAAFTSMRARGTQITDMAILVVAADDNIMPQTVEAINHAKAANMPIIVAINKIDRPDANVEAVKQKLTEHSLVPEEWGGDIITVPISAKTGEGIDELLENILLIAEVSELKANPNRLAQGTVIEAQLDRGRGPVATLLVQNGTIKKGDTLIAGTTVGRIRAMTDDMGNEIESAGPSTPVEITGLNETPSAGDLFNVVENERLARELAQQRREEAKEMEFSQYQKVTLDNLFSQIEEGQLKELTLIIKADVQGTSEAVKQSLEKLTNEEVRVRVIHSGVGAINESDVMLADASNAIIVGFNVRPDARAEINAEAVGVDLHMYRVIYDAIDDVKAAMIGMLAPKYRDVNIGKIEVRDTYSVSKIGTIAGCYVVDGKVTRSSLVRVVRDGVVVIEDKIASLKRFQDDVKEVRSGYECGISLEKFNDIKIGDIFESYIVEEYQDYVDKDD